MAILKNIGRYEIKGRIGGGGMGTLYLALDTNPKTSRLVALKLLRANLDSEDLRRRFELEAQALAQMSHPNIVVIHDSGEYDEAPYIVMEFIRGETLAELIERRARVPLGRKLRWLRELCAGLGSAHESGFIHRDVKPANLMVDRRGPLKILDFGIARSDDLMKTLAAGRLTQLNMQIGTPGYVSPEQIEGVEVDARSDVFAVGAVAYEVLAYRQAFRGETTRQIETNVLTSQPPPIESIVPDLDPRIVEAIRSALEKDPARRCPDVATLGQTLEHVLAHMPSEDSSPRVAPVRKAGPDGRSRHERSAELAFEVALAARADGGVELAKRSALETLAELPLHVGARQLLRDLGSFGNVEPWLPTPESGEELRPALPPRAASDVGAVLPPEAPTMLLPSLRTTASPRPVVPPLDLPTLPVRPPSRPQAATPPTVLASPLPAPRRASGPLTPQPGFALPPPDPRLLLSARSRTPAGLDRPTPSVVPPTVPNREPAQVQGEKSSRQRPLPAWVAPVGIAGASLLLVLLLVSWLWR